MKKTIILLLTALSVVSANAQLEVNQNGHVAIGATTPSFHPVLAVGNHSESYSNIGIGVSTKGVESTKNVAIKAYTNGNLSTTTGSNFGIVGIAKMNLNHGRNFGVSGMVDFSNSNFYGGAGVYATHYAYMYSTPDNLQGLYAAYFNGTTNLQGG